MMKATSIKNNCVLLILLLSSLSCASLSAQKKNPESAQMITTIGVEALNFASDKLGQVYVANPRNEIVKYDPNGKELFRYSNNKLGTLYLIDVTDPFNVLLYYRDFATIITLDRTLNITGESNLYDLDIVEVEAVGMSNDNNIWLYDELAFKLKKISRNAEVILESDNLSLSLDQEQGFQVNFITERNNRVFLNDPARGILVFDLYGRYLRTIELKELERFQILDQQLIFRKGGQYFSLHLQTLQQRELQLPIQKLNPDWQISWQKDRIYVKSPEEIKIFRTKKNSSQ